MALLVDKLRPKTLDALTYHPELSDRLRSLVSRPSTRQVKQELNFREPDCRLKAATFPIY